MTNGRDAAGAAFCLYGDVQNEADIGDLRASQVFEDGYQVEEFVVVGVGEPGADGYCVVRVEDVGCRGVVDDDGVLEVAANL
jgi:hypothetical protein